MTDGFFFELLFISYVSFMTELPLELLSFSFGSISQTDLLNFVLLFLSNSFFIPNDNCFFTFKLFELIFFNLDSFLSDKSIFPIL